MPNFADKLHLLVDSILHAYIVAYVKFLRFYLEVSWKVTIFASESKKMPR